MNYAAWLANVFNQVLASASDWLSQIFTATGTVPVYFYFIGVVLAVRFLIKPLVGSKIRGGAGSDKAKKREEDEA